MVFQIGLTDKEIVFSIPPGAPILKEIGQFMNCPYGYSHPPVADRQEVSFTSVLPLPQPSPRGRGSIDILFKFPLYLCQRKVKGTLVPFCGSGGIPQIPIIPPSPAGEGGQGDEVSIFISLQL